MLKKFETQIKTFQDKFGTDVIIGAQGTLPWLQSRLGVITASEAHAAVAGAKTDKRDTYMCKLVAEIAAGMVEEINSKYMDWGHMNEPAARASYEFANDCKIDQVSFIFKDDTFREGASLDGFVKGKAKAVEIKCPYNTTNYIKFLIEDKIKSEYQWQYQHQIRVAGVDQIDFIQFDPRMTVQPYKVLTVERSEKFQADFNELIPAFISDMDKMLAKLGLTYGDQWTRLAVKVDEAVVA